MALYESMLSFDVFGYYDIRQSGIVGQTISSLYKHISNNKIIHEISNINWDDDFDSVILGHTDKIQSIVGFNYQQEFINKCKIHKKFLYSFDYIYQEFASNNSMNYFSPFIDNKCVPYGNMGKLHTIKTPVLGIYGTSSRQGKYSLQLLLRSYFKDNGYEIAQIGTEPSGYLFDFDAVYPMGYQSNVFISHYDAIMTLNEMMHLCDIKDKDLIITGCQSGTIPYSNHHISYMPLSQYEFILGTQPDLIVLCINYHDNIDYIKRTVNYLESICESHLIGCVLYPLYYKNNNIIRMEECSADEFLLKRTEIKDILGKTTYFLNDVESIKMLYQDIVGWFSNQ